MTPTTKNKTAGLSQAQSKRIEETLCRMAEECRTHSQITEARKALTAEFLALNAPAEPVPGL